MSKDPYEILGVSRNCSDRALKHAWLKKCKRYHPDANPDNMAEAEFRFKEVQTAYEQIQKERAFERVAFEEDEHGNSNAMRYAYQKNTADEERRTTRADSYYRGKKTGTRDLGLYGVVFIFLTAFALLVFFLFIMWDTGDDGNNTEYAEEEHFRQKYEFNLLSDYELEIKKYTGHSTKVNIHDWIEGYTVVGIGDNAFSNNENLTEINIESGIERIGEGAFSNCVNMEKITIPVSVKWIGDEAFWGDSHLEIQYEGTESDWEKIEIGEESITHVERIVYKT